MKKLLGTLTAIAIAASPLAAHAACSAADLVGRWHMDFDIKDTGWHGQAKTARIDNLGRMTGSVHYWDNTALPEYGIHTFENLRIDADCYVYAGGIQLWYGGSPDMPNENGGRFGMRLRMNPSKNGMTGGVFRAPHADMSATGPVMLTKY